MERPAPSKWSGEWISKNSADGLVNVAAVSMHHGLCAVPERLY